MSIKVCLAADTIDYPQGGGHLWVYLNWALGLRAAGSSVVWLEEVNPDDSVDVARTKVEHVQQALAPYGLPLALCSPQDEPLAPELKDLALDLDAVCDADLLVNMHYSMSPSAVGHFRRSALLDIDPGLLQVWLGQGVLALAPHDAYFTTGETVETVPRHREADLRWQHTRPVVYLPEWPVAEEGGAAFTTVSAWWDQWVTLGAETFANHKRDSFLEFVEMPRHTDSQLELAVCWGEDEEEDRQTLEDCGWRVVHAWDVSSTPEEYRAYIQRSRGEFSCAKPSCLRLQNAWISDRTLCYLASGKPAVVQYTGPSTFLPDSGGLFRFRTMDEAAHALAVVEADGAHQGELARELAEEYFDATSVARSLLERALG